MAENELDNINVNYIHSATESQNHKELASHFNVIIHDQKRYIKYTRKEILDYMENWLMTKGDVEEQLEFIDDFDSVRYIRLVHRHSKSTYSPHVYMKLNTYMYNAFIPNHFITNDDDFKSLQTTLPHENPIHTCCAIISDKLLLTPIDTRGEISVVCEQPMGNPVMLNVNRPGLLRQYYGCDVCYKSHYIITRVLYGYGSKRNSIRTDPSKFVTKPFDYNMLYMAPYIRRFFYRNATEFN